MNEGKETGGGGEEERDRRHGGAAADVVLGRPRQNGACDREEAASPTLSSQVTPTPPPFFAVTFLRLKLTPRTLLFSYIKRGSSRATAK